MDTVWPAPASAAAGHWSVLPVFPGLVRPGLVFPNWFPGQGVAGHAAFARRIRRRRSEARSSSFRPPQVPYFSGLEIA